MALFALFASMLAFMFMRVYMPFGKPHQGKVFRVLPLNLIERALLQRVNVYSLCFVLLLTLATGAQPAAYQLPIVVLAMAALTIPARFFITNAGIGLNNVFFRPWGDFKGFRVEARRVVLVANDGLRDVSIPALASHQKELTSALRRFLHPMLEQERRQNRRGAIGAS
jgi:hypothetical protein